MIYCYPGFSASLGQVYKGRLKENGDLVAVKVQRPFVLETVTVDLFVIRNLGLFLRKFPQARFCQRLSLCSSVIVLFHLNDFRSSFSLGNFCLGVSRCCWTC